MPDITIDQATYDKLRFSAALMNRPVGDVVQLLVERLDPPAGPVAGHAVPGTPPRDLSGNAPVETHAPKDEWVAVFRVYKGRRFEGQFNPSTMQLEITTEPWSGEVFPSPTAAAQAVVDHVPGPRETNNTNGRKFWRLLSGGDLRTIVGQRF